MWKTLLIGSFLFAGCAHKHDRVKIYWTVETGLYRKQDNELVPFKDAEGYFCQQAVDFRLTAACVANDNSIYVIDADLGFLNSRDNERIEFGTSKHFYCVTPDDFVTILKRCDDEFTHT